MVRRIGMVLTALGVVGFVITFFHVVTHDTPSTCYGSDCFHGENRWIVAMPGSIFAFVGGVLMVAFGNRGYGKTHGPKSFADVDSGAWAPQERAQRPERTRPVPRWSRSWRNVYGGVGFGELGLGLMFVIAGIIEPDARAGGFLTGGLLSAIGIVFLYVGWRAAQKDGLHERGIAGTARITGIEQTAMMMNSNPYVKFNFVVTVPGHQPYEVHHGEIVPLVLLGRLVTGESLPVRVDPDKPSHFVVEWENA